MNGLIETASGLQTFCDGQGWKSCGSFNNRDEMNDGDRFIAVMKQIVGKRLTYKELIGKDQPELGETTRF